MLIERIEDLERDLNYVKLNLSALPTWIPLTLEYAKECGYKTTDGLRRWCMKNLSLEEFTQKGRFWCIHRKALVKTKQKRV